MRSRILPCCALLFLAGCRMVAGRDDGVRDEGGAGFDRYGGSTRLQCLGGERDRFYAEKIRDRWWLCTPAGNVFWAMGVYAAAPDNSTDPFGVNHYTLVRDRYATGVTDSGILNWSAQTVKRLKSWGFNTLDMYGYLWILPWAVLPQWPLDPATNMRTIPDKMPSLPPNFKPTWYSMGNQEKYLDQPVKDLMTGIRQSVYAGWRGAITDYYDERFVQWLISSSTNNAWNRAPGVNADWVFAVVADDRDELWWAGAGDDFRTSPPGKTATHAGWAILVTAPVMAARRFNGRNVMFADQTVYAKAHLESSLAAKYGTIEALNAAWGASYSTFNTTGTSVRGELVGIGNGIQKEFSCTLAQHAPSPFSIQVFVDGTLQAGDDGAGAFWNLSNNARGVGKVDFSTGAATIVLGEAPPLGAEVRVNYVSCGFGCGTGLLDEDGSHPWVPRVNSANQMTGGNGQIRTDIGELLFQYAARYFGTIKSQVAVSFPGNMYLGPSSLGGWNAPPRAQVLQAASQYLDMLRLDPPDPVTADWAERINFIARWGGDKPWTITAGAKANPDSYFANDPRGASAACDQTRFQTQAQRGQWYQVLLSRYAEPAGDGIRHLVGVNFWQLVDNRRECSNWGLLTRRDNPYDGVSAVMAPGVDAWGYPTGTELADYGDFIGAVKLANSIWMPSGTASGLKRR